jgi:hypothetical protein
MRPAWAVLWTVVRTVARPPGPDRPHGSSTGLQLGCGESTPVAGVDGLGGPAHLAGPPEAGAAVPGLSRVRFLPGTPVRLNEQGGEVIHDGTPTNTTVAHRPHAGVDPGSTFASGRPTRLPPPPPGASQGQPGGRTAASGMGRLPGAARGPEESSLQGRFAAPTACVPLASPGPAAAPEASGPARSSRVTPRAREGPRRPPLVPPRGVGRQAPQDPCAPASPAG